MTDSPAPPLYPPLADVPLPRLDPEVVADGPSVKQAHFSRGASPHSDTLMVLARYRPRSVVAQTRGKVPQTRGSETSFPSREHTAASPASRGRLP
jgi:hypothetical protein